MLLVVMVPGSMPLYPNRMLKKAVPAFSNAPNPAQVRVRLRRIKRLRARFAGEASLPRLYQAVFQQPDKF